VRHLEAKTASCTPPTVNPPLNRHILVSQTTLFNDYFCLFSGFLGRLEETVGFPPRGSQSRDRNNPENDGFLSHLIARSLSTPGPCRPKPLLSSKPSKPHLFASFSHTSGNNTSGSRCFPRRCFRLVSSLISRLFSGFREMTPSPLAETSVTRLSSVA